MTALTFFAGEHLHELDCCALCQSVWLDAGEFEKLPPPRPDSSEELSPKARAALALVEVELLAQSEELKREQYRKRKQSVWTDDATAGVFEDIIPKVLQALLGKRIW